jgi:two-component system CheB/CheR fusion protein
VKQKVKSKVELPATLKEAVQGQDQSLDTPIFGIDINHLKHNIDLLKYSLDYAEAIVNTVREPLIILNKNLQVITANRAFYKSFEILPDKLENRPFFELGSGELNIPKFKKTVAKRLSKRD